MHVDRLTTRLACALFVIALVGRSASAAVIVIDDFTAGRGHFTDPLTPGTNANGGYCADTSAVAHDPAVGRCAPPEGPGGAPPTRAVGGGAPWLLLTRSVTVATCSTRSASEAER